MGKKLDAILGRGFKSLKFRGLISLAISRIAVLKNQRQVRCSQARSDVAQLLQQGQRDRALTRVEQVIKEQNMLDVLVMLEGHCNLLIERIHLIEQDRMCSDELKEAVSCLLYASIRCGDFPELQEIRAVFTSWYGKEFAARATELRNNCGVPPKMIQKLSTRQPDMEKRRAVLKEIASETNIALPLEEMDATEQQNQPEQQTSTISNSQPKASEKPGTSLGDISREGLSDSMKTRKKYKDVADAAQAAFESAAYAAEAARAAVELSRSDSHDPDHQNSPRNQGRIFPAKLKSLSVDQVHDTTKEAGEQNAKGITELKRSASISSAESSEGSKHIKKDVAFDESDNEVGNASTSKTTSEHVPLFIQTGKKLDQTQDAAEGSEVPTLNFKKGPISVRTKRLQGY